MGIALNEIAMGSERRKFVVALAEGCFVVRGAEVAANVVAARKQLPKQKKETSTTKTKQQNFVQYEDLPVGVVNELVGAGDAGANSNRSSLRCCWGDTTEEAGVGGGGCVCCGWGAPGNEDRMLFIFSSYECVWG